MCYCISYVLLYIIKHNIHYYLPRFICHVCHVLQYCFQPLIFLHKAYRCGLRYSPEHFQVHCIGVPDPVASLSYRVNSQYYEIDGGRCSLIDQYLFVSQVLFQNPDLVSQPVVITTGELQALLKNFFSVEYVFKSGVTMSVSDQHIRGLTTPPDFGENNCAIYYIIQWIHADPELRL